MTFANYLKGQLTDYVDSYKNYFGRTFGAALTFTVVCFVGVALFLRFSDFDESVSEKQITIVAFFFRWFSRANIYSIVDLSKPFFIFIVAFFSIGLSRQSDDQGEKKELSFLKLLSKIKPEDILFLILMFLFSSFVDFVLATAENNLPSLIFSQSVNRYLYDLLFNMRIYIPLIVSALMIRSLTVSEKSRMTFRRICFLYVSLWLFNEFAYEIFIWARNYIFSLILLPVEDPGRRSLLETFLSIPLVAFYFLGYSSAMTASLRLTEPKTIQTDLVP